MKRPPRMLRPMLCNLLCGALACLAAGCAPLGVAAGAWAGVDAVVAVPVFGRGTADLVYSAVSGRDCSMVRLEQGRTYCRPREGPPDPQPFCTRSLGTVDCWADPALPPGRPAPVADTPAPTAEQRARRTARWPDL